MFTFFPSSYFCTENIYNVIKIVRLDTVGLDVFIFLYLYNIKCSHKFNIYTTTLKLMYYSTLINKKLDPWFVTGFSDGVASFVLSIVKSSKVGFSTTTACFQIQLHIKYLELLNQIKNYFNGVGSITIHKNRCVYMVNGFSNIINVIIPHFDKYPLKTKKLGDYLLFKNAVLNIIKDKKHLTLPGIKELLSIKASMNKGLSLKKFFLILFQIL